MIQFTKETCGDLDAAVRREWLETNGLGGFASSTIIGLNTRRYHGLLVAATKQIPTGLKGYECRRKSASGLCPRRLRKRNRATWIS